MLYTYIKLVFKLMYALLINFQQALFILYSFKRNEKKSADIQSNTSRSLSKIGSMI